MTDSSNQNDDNASSSSGSTIKAPVNPEVLVFRLEWAYDDNKPLPTQYYQYVEKEGRFGRDMMNFALKQAVDAEKVRAKLLVVNVREDRDAIIASVEKAFPFKRLKAVIHSLDLELKVPGEGVCQKFDLLADDWGKIKNGLLYTSFEYPHPANCIRLTVQNELIID